MTHGAPPPGGHPLPTSFGSAAMTTASAASLSQGQRRKTRPRLLLTIGGIALVALACGGIHLGANLGYDDALIAFEKTAQDAEDGDTLLESELVTLDDTTVLASGVADADSGALMDTAAKEALTSALADAEAVAADTTSIRAQTIPQADEKPDWAWELFGETAQLTADRGTAEQLIRDFESAGEDSSSAADALQEAGTAAVSSAADASAAFEAAHVSARNTAIVALRNAAERVHASDEVLDGTVQSAYLDLETAAAQMLASEKAEIAEKSGPLYNARLEVEAFARSLAPGVLLDFDWSERVNGFGYGDSMGGYATWWYQGPGYATIELSNSVAANWPSDRSKALIAHEVGHTMSVKCDGMYDDSTQQKIEAWATAWAISMGFHDDANGTWAYGAPPQSLIDTAAGCR